MKKKIILILSCMILLVAFIVINRYWLYDDLDREKIRPIVTKYLEEKVAIGVSEKSFCSYQELGAEKVSDSKIRYYIYMRCDGITEKMKEASGEMFPLALTIDLNKNIVLDHDEPRDGTFYAEDIKMIFPWYISFQLLYLDNIDVKELEKENLQRAKKYYESGK